MLLNDLDGVAALDEPFDREVLSRLDARSFVPFIEETFEKERQSILESGFAHSTKEIGGNGLGNHYGDTDRQTGLRSRKVDYGRISIKKSLSPDFTLVIKHTIPFTGVIDDLTLSYPTFALVRNPLAILASWNSIDAAYRDGEIQDYARALTGDLYKRLSVQDRYERQVRLLEWHFEKYLAIPPQHVIRYEEVVESRLNRLRVITGGMGFRGTTGKARRSSEELDLLFRKLTARPDSSPIFCFYDRDSIEDMYLSMSEPPVMAASA